MQTVCHSVLHGMSNVAIFDPFQLYCIIFDLFQLYCIIFPCNLYFIFSICIDYFVLGCIVSFPFVM